LFIENCIGFWKRVEWNALLFGYPMGWLGAGFCWVCLAVICSCVMHGDGEWDARAALPWLGESLAVVGVAVAGFVSGGPGGDGWMAMEWMGLDVSSRVWPGVLLGTAGLMNLRV